MSHESGMRLWIGLDGGGSGCRAQAQLEDGRRSPMLTGGAANVLTDPDGALGEIATLLARCIAQAQALEPGGALQEPVVVLGLAGAHESGAGTQIAARLPFRHVTVLGDLDIALMGALMAQDGIVMAVGTGSVLGRQTAGRTQRVGGYGLVLGDDGSGAWIGREALRRCLLARDGLVTDGPLTQQIWARFGSVRAMVGFGASARPADFAALAPLVLDHDRAGCPVAKAILDDACDYFRRAIEALQDGDADIAVAACGGLGPVLLDRMVRQGRAPLRRIAPAGTALDGALWHARQLPPERRPDTTQPANAGARDD